MKIVRSIGFLIITLLFIGGGCAKTNDSDQVQEKQKPLPAGFVRYTQQTDKWSIGYPSDWEKDETQFTQNGLTFFFSPEDSKGIRRANVNVNFSPNVVNVSDEEIISTVRAELTAAGAKDIIGDVIMLSFGKAVQISYNLIQDGELLYGKQYGFFNNNNFYVITFTGDKVGFDAYKQTFEDIIATFTPKSS